MAKQAIENRRDRRRGPAQRHLPCPLGKRPRDPHVPLRKDAPKLHPGAGGRPREMRDVSLRSVEGPHHVSVQVARRARPGRSACAWSMRTFLSQASEPASSSCRPRVRAARVGAGCCPSALPAGCACARWPGPHPRTPQKRGPLGGRGGEAPRQPPPGTHRVWPRGLCLLVTDHGPKPAPQGSRLVATATVRGLLQVALAHGQKREPEEDGTVGQRR